jgi:transcriptional enhancer factor
VKPAIFWLLVTSAKIRDDCGDLYETDNVSHRYSRLSSQSQQVNLDFVLNWCQKFPHLESLYNAGELDCDIIHMDVSLNLMETHAEDGADLVTRSEISVTSQENETYEWQTVTSFIKPPGLCRDYCAEHLESNVTPAKVLFSNAEETRLKVRFPAEQWAHILTRLTDLQLKYDEAERCHTLSGESFLDTEQPVQEHLQQVSMYQEVQSCFGLGLPFIRRAIILWTFRPVAAGESAETTWRYVDPTLSHSWMSPSSSSSQRPSSVKADNFSTWSTSSPQLQLQHQGVLDPYVRGLVTPPSTAGLQSTFAPENYGYHNLQFNMHPEDLSFASITNTHAEPTLLDNNIATDIDAYLSNASDVRIGYFGHDPTSWNINNTVSVNAGPAWPNYEALPASASQVESESGVTHHGLHMDMDPRLTHWTETKERKGNWTEMNLVKQKALYMEQGDDKLLCWLDPANSEIKDLYVDNTDEGQLPKLSPKPIDTRGLSWIGGDISLDFNQLVERLRA